MPNKGNNLRVIVVNCNSASGKKAELANLCDYLDPDVMILTETKIDSTVHYAEFLPEGYTGDIRKDRVMGGGGVMIAYRSSLIAVEVKTPSEETETIWAKVTLQDGKSTLVGAYYRPPSDRTTNTVKTLDKILDQLDPNSPIILGGDFNAGDINWEDNTVTPGSDRKALCEELIQTLGKHDLEQLQREPTRDQAILDLYCTNRPGLIKSLSTIPGISDHNIIVADSDLRARLAKKPKRSINQWTKANWDSIHQETAQFQEDFMNSYKGRSVEENYTEFCNHIESITKQHVPSKTSSTRRNVPWLTPNIKRMTRKKQRLFNHAKKTGKEMHWAQYRSFKRATTKALNKARWNYINGILQTGIDEGNTKPFWRYIYSQKNDRSGVAPLKEGSTLVSDSKSKAEMLNQQFTSVFTKDDTNGDTVLPGPSYPPIEALQIQTAGVEKLLKNLQPNKAAGPDHIPCRLLKELSVELAPVLTVIFTQSIESSELPSTWLKADVAPVFKKGSTCLPENYRPVSLTCVTCKILEHIICSHVRAHLDKHGILTHLQHGFRSKHSCETQLLTTLQDFLNIRDNNTQTDLAVLDFSKAFDKVSHKRLLGKLRLYGLEGPISQWICAFLTDRTQRVRVEGDFSKESNVTSGVPQGTVLGPLLFLMFINDLPAVLDPGTSCRLFADDCIIYRQIRSLNDQLQLQKDLTALETWSHRWGMQFNAKKCIIMSISRKPAKVKFYQLDNTILDNVDACTYLGVLISGNLDWSQHISKCAKKANSRLGFLRRNLKGCPQKLKRTGYVSLIRSLLEYSSVVWDPHLQKDRDAIERVQRKAARWITGDHSTYSSVTGMLSQLGLESLELRRKNQRLIMMYKIVHRVVALSTQDLGILPADGRTRSAHKFKLRVPRASTAELKNSFVNRTIPDWNRLPASQAEAGSVDQLKSQLAPCQP
jgi:hypothetical protein